MEPRSEAGRRAGQADLASGPTRGEVSRGQQKHRRGRSKLRSQRRPRESRPASGCGSGSCGLRLGGAPRRDLGVAQRGVDGAWTGRGRAVAQATAPAAQKRRGRLGLVVRVSERWAQPDSARRGCGMRLGISAFRRHLFPTQQPLTPTRAAARRPMPGWGASEERK